MLVFLTFSLTISIFFFWVWGLVVVLWGSGSLIKKKNEHASTEGEACENLGVGCAILLHFHNRMYKYVFRST